jgi:hypothetical protein
MHRALEQKEHMDSKSSYQPEYLEIPETAVRSMFMFVKARVE